jgi:hypothetical protein
VPSTTAQDDQRRDRDDRGYGGCGRRSEREPRAPRLRPFPHAQREPVRRRRLGLGRAVRAALPSRRKRVPRPNARLHDHGLESAARARGRLQRARRSRPRDDNAVDGRLHHRRAPMGWRHQHSAARRLVGTRLRLRRSWRSCRRRRHRDRSRRRWRRGHCGGNGRRCRRPSRGKRLRGRRQEEQRVEVALGVGGQAYAEVHVRHCLLGDAADAGGADGLALADGRAPPNRQRAEMQQRHGVPVRRLDRERAPAGRHCAREGDDPGRGRGHRCAWRGTHVDAAVEARDVRV